MSQKDILFLGLLAALIIALTAPALRDSGLFLGNFGDIYAYHFPLQHLTTASLQSGRLPFWNGYIFAGLPHLANSQTAVYYGPALLFRMFPLGWAFSAYAALHLFLAGLGMHLLMRSRGLSAGGSAALSAAYALAPFVMYRVAQGIPTHLAALALAPWCWLALLSRRSGFLAAAWSLQAFSGHPQFAVLNALAMAVYAGVCRERGRVLRYFLGEGFGAALLTAVVWFPMAEFMSASNRGELPAAFSAAYAMPLRALGTLLWPGFAGDPLAGTFGDVPSVFFESFVLYLGLAPLALAGIGLAFSRREAYFGWALAAAGFFAATQADLPLAFSRVPARFGFWIVLGMFAAASGGWQALNKRGWSSAARAALWLFVLADAGPWAARFLWAESGGDKLAPAASFAEALAGRPTRVLIGTDSANPNKTMLYRAMGVNGYDAFLLASFTRYAAMSENGPAVDGSRSYLRDPDTPQMSALGVSHALGLGLRRLDGARALARFDDAAGSPASVDIPRPERWSVSGIVPEGAHSLVVSAPHYPGWRAYLNGRRAPLTRHDQFLSAVSLEDLGPGTAADLRLLFIPTGWALLVSLSSAAWILWWKVRLMELP